MKRGILVLQGDDIEDSFVDDLELNLNDNMNGKNPVIGNLENAYFIEIPDNGVRYLLSIQCPHDPLNAEEIAEIKNDIQTKSILVMSNVEVNLIILS